MQIQNMTKLLIYFINQTCLLLVFYNHLKRNTAPWCLHIDPTQSQTTLYYGNYNKCVLTAYLSDKNPKEQQCEVPCEEQETGTDPQVVEEGEIQQSC